MAMTSVVVTGAAGRMGSAVVRLAAGDPGVDLAGVVGRPESLGRISDLGCPASSDLGELLADTPGAVVIDFTAPEASLATARACRTSGNPAIIGTTGFKPEQLKELEAAADEAPIFWSPNMSVGVNVLLKVLPGLVQMLGPDYDLEMVEIHHNKKADAPSGTAVKLAQSIAAARGQTFEDVAVYGRSGITGARKKEEYGVMALRGGDVVGDHTAYFFGPGERIEITHRAHSRDTLARGAILAAKWMVGKRPGRLYAMSDLLDEAR